jgi:hypothetical protein
MGVDQVPTRTLRYIKGTEDRTMPANEIRSPESLAVMLQQLHAEK